MSEPEPSMRIDEQRVRALQRLRCKGSVSILMQCSGQAEVDRRHLRRAVEEASRRVVLEVPMDEADIILDRLERVAERAIVPSARTVAVFASTATAEVLHLDLEVPSRVVIDDTFATRDLLLAVHQQPVLHVVTLGDHVTRCFAGKGVHLEEVRDERFPMLRVVDEFNGDTRQTRSIDDYARDLERRLRSSLPDDGAPVVLIGSPRRLAAVADRPLLQRRAARTVPRQMERASVAEVSSQVAPIATSLVAGRRVRALDATREAVGRHRAAVGLRDVWDAATRGHVRTLVVERGYHVAARLHPDGVTFARTEDATEPGVVDDLVDELIEQVLATRGGVVIVDDGDLAHAERVTAVLRHRSP